MHRHFSNWLAWLVGVALLASVVTLAVQFAEQREFARLLERAHPWWLLLAVALQAGTYFAAAEVWRSVTRACNHPVSLGTTYRLSIAKLFMDQAVPTGGVSGTLLYVQGLCRAGLNEGAALAGVVVATFSYYAGYALCLSVALVLAAGAKYLSEFIIGVAVIFLVASTALSVTVLLRAGRRAGAFAARLERIPVLRQVLRLLRGADATLARDPRVLARAIGWQISIVLLDAATIWVLLRAVDVIAAPSSVFASYLFSSYLLHTSLSFSQG